MGEVVDLFPEWSPPYNADCLTCEHNWTMNAKAPKNIRCPNCGARKAILLENDQMVIAVVR